MEHFVFIALVVPAVADRDATPTHWLPAALHPLSGRPASPQPQPSVAEAGYSPSKTMASGTDQYQGAKRAHHLGGFTRVDQDGLSPALWRYMMQNLTAKSVIDLGCGKGVSTSWFLAHDADVLCVEGSHEGVQASLLPPARVVEHDFSRGPWWPPQTFDVAWSVEFAEHVGRQHMANYLPILESAALVFITHSSWGGWHHVEVHDDTWWRTRLAAAGLVYSDALTKKAKAIAMAGHQSGETSSNGVQYRAQHLWTNLQVYLNPAVLRLPRHAHLVGGEACFGGQIGRDDLNLPCEDARATPFSAGLGPSDALPPAFRPLPGAFRSDAQVGWAPPDHSGGGNKRKAARGNKLKAAGKP